jgi:hypothetical protein
MDDRRRRSRAGRAFVKMTCRCGWHAGLCRAVPGASGARLAITAIEAERDAGLIRSCDVGDARRGRERNGSWPTRSPRQFDATATTALRRSSCRTSCSPSNVTSWSGRPQGPRRDLRGLRAREDPDATRVGRERPAPHRQARADRRAARRDLPDVAEAEKFGIDAAVSRDGSVPAGITVTNYDRLHLFDSTDFGGAVCDESSAIKAFDGQRRALVTEFMRKMRYRLLARPRPRRTTTSSSARPAKRSATSGTWTCSIGSSSTREDERHEGPLPGIRRAAPVGAEDLAIQGPRRGPVLAVGVVVGPRDAPAIRPRVQRRRVRAPALEHHQHIVEANVRAMALLFDLPALGIREEREELRRTVNERCEMAASRLGGSTAGIAWCHLNAESER